MSTGGKAVLTALAKKTAKLGLVFYDMKNVAKSIGEIL
jgi:predicted regulator of Ras-like GTPase activity (Roadblock/LC7/MglB family)